jgi:hypothetical protein
MYKQQLTDFLGAIESSKSLLGDIFRRHTLLLSSLTIYFLCTLCILNKVEKGAGDVQGDHKEQF